MKIFIPNISQQQIGGGWTFLRNFKNGMGLFGYDFVDRWQDADIVLVAGVSMTDVGDVIEAKKAGKKIVFRVDNIPKKSRNKRGRVYDKMRQFGQLADAIVFQSEWAKDYAGFLTGNLEKAKIIYNGVDTQIFYAKEQKVGLDQLMPPKKYLFVHFNRDENKRFPEAAYYFHQLWRKNHEVSLTIVGAFSPDLIDADFDFFAGEDVMYIPPVADQVKMAEIYRAHDVLLFPAYADAAPNTVLEARACGLKVKLVNPVGGTIEIIDPNLDISLDRMCRDYDNLFKNI